MLLQEFIHMVTLLAAHEVTVTEVRRESYGQQHLLDAERTLLLPALLYPTAEKKKSHDSLRFISSLVSRGRPMVTAHKSHQQIAPQKLNTRETKIQKCLEN